MNTKTETFHDKIRRCSERWVEKFHPEGADLIKVNQAKHYAEDKVVPIKGAKTLIPTKEELNPPPENPLNLHFIKL